MLNLKKKLLDKIKTKRKSQATEACKCWINVIMLGQVIAAANKCKCVEFSDEKC